MESQPTDADIDQQWNEYTVEISTIGVYVINHGKPW
jgi:hypothetical protein